VFSIIKLKIRARCDQGNSSHLISDSSGSRCRNAKFLSRVENLLRVLHGRTDINGPVRDFANVFPLARRYGNIS
jgi:hypothetical protein